MVKLLVVLIVALVAFDPVSAADATITIELGGLRQAKAVLTITESEYVAKVLMLPAQCFDSTTNSRLNREKARELALQALAKHLSNKEAVEFTVSGVQIEKVGVEGKFYTLNLRLPRKGVSVVPDGKKPAVKQGEDRLAFTSELFTRKRDYLNTLDTLMGVVTFDVQEADEKAGESFSRAIAEIEERGIKNLENLRKEIKNDLLLLSFEQEELNDVLSKQKIKMLGQFKEAVKKKATKEKTP